LADIYEKGEIEEKDIEESGRLRRIRFPNSKRAMMYWNGGYKKRTRLSSSEELGE